MIERKQRFTHSKKESEIECILRLGSTSFTILEDGKFIIVAKHFADCLNYRSEELLDQNILDFIHPIDRDYFGDIVLGDFPPNFMNMYRVRAVSKDQSFVDLEIRAKRECVDGRNLFYILETRTNAQRISDERIVHEIEERFRTAFNYAAVGMALVSVNGRFLDVNFALCEIMGYSEDELSAMTFQSIIHMDDLELYLDSNTSLLIGEVPCYEMEKRWIHKTGRMVWGLLNTTLVRDDDGKPLYYIMQMQDITKRKETEELLRKSDKLSAVGQLAAGVAHEVRNPLTVLKGFAQVLQTKDSDNHEYYRLMLSEVERIEGIISEFLMMARPRDTLFSENDIDRLISDVVVLMQTKAIMNNVRIITNNDCLQTSLECDESQLKQVFINIIQNAIEAMPQGGDITIQIQMEQETFISISITDQGCGIPQERITKLGEPFYSNKEKGTGLGLMICYKIIDKHNGQIKIHSELDVGTTFKIILPISQESN